MGFQNFPGAGKSGTGLSAVPEAPKLGRQVEPERPETCLVSCSLPVKAQGKAFSVKCRNCGARTYTANCEQCGLVP
jgi:hypothetical protein